MYPPGSGLLRCTAIRSKPISPHQNWKGGALSTSPVVAAYFSLGTPLQPCHPVKLPSLQPRREIPQQGQSLSPFWDCSLSGGDSGPFRVTSQNRCSTAQGITCQARCTQEVSASFEDPFSVFPKTVRRSPGVTRHAACLSSCPAFQHSCKQLPGTEPPFILSSGGCAPAKSPHASLLLQDRCLQLTQPAEMSQLLCFVLFFCSVPYKGWDNQAPEPIIFSVTSRESQHQLPTTSRMTY